MNHMVRRLLGVLLGPIMLLAQGLMAEEKSFSTDQLDQLVAPISLYPDPVVAQVLMAATYPLEVVEAQRWLEKNQGLTDQQLYEQGAGQGWDPSVVSMLHFPAVLKLLGENSDWTQELGDAVLAQQGDVMAAVQRMRERAYEEGNIKSTDQQKVVVEEEVIRIEPATEVVYVPAYDPTVVYGPSWTVPAPYYPWYGYPPSYWYPPGYAAGAGLVTFGVGMTFGAAIWGNTDWGHGDIDVDVNRNVNVNHSGGNWEHNVEHRGGVRYRDAETRELYDQGARDARAESVARDVDRGFESSATRELQSGSDIARTGGDSAFSTSRSGSATRSASSRGFASSGGGGFSRGGGGFGRGGGRR